MDKTISASDKELDEVIPKLLQISYEYIIHLYIANQKEGDPPTKKEWILDESRMKEIYAEI